MEESTGEVTEATPRNSAQRTIPVGCSTEGCQKFAVWMDPSSRLFCDRHCPRDDQPLAPFRWAVLLGDSIHAPFWDITTSRVLMPQTRRKGQTHGPR
jgi:hypothetical protein